MKYYTVVNVNDVISWWKYKLCKEIKEMFEWQEIRVNDALIKPKT